MKFSTLQPGYFNRRSNSFRGQSSPLDSSVDGTVKSPVALFWLVLHGLCCLISLVLGFRFSRLVLYLLFSSSSSLNIYSSSPFLRTRDAVEEALPFHSTFMMPYVGYNRTLFASPTRRVVVGRHGIRIRPWPHPNPEEVMKAYSIIERVQREQRFLHGVKNPRTVIAITPTYVRTFQALHLAGVMHSLMNVPYDLIWIVVEAGGITKETGALLEKSGLKTIHIGFDQRMPNLWEERHKMETQMRLKALRVVREQKLDGIVMFADDSNMHTMELFDEIQNVRWFGAVSVGILARFGDTDEVSSSSSQHKDEEENLPMPVQGPACNSSKKLVGWHTFNPLSYGQNSAVNIGDRATVFPKKVEWAGFVLSSRLLWKEDDNKPEWMNDLDTLDNDIESPLFLLKDTSKVEPLGECGRKIMLWWLRVEARYDSKFPPGWTINPPLEITIPAKRTPWPDAPREIPSHGNLNSVQDHTEKHHAKTRTSRSKRSSRNKRRRETKVPDARVSAKHSAEKRSIMS